jgi:hypothetical protein
MKRKVPREFKELINCWQYMSCGREPGGINTPQSGVCPASTDSRLDGVHGGKNAGRACWAVAGSFAKGNAEGTFAKGHKDCTKCDFYNQIRQEEGRHTWPTTFLLKLLEGKKT